MRINVIKRNQKHLNRVHVLFDAFIIICSYILAWAIKFYPDIPDNDRHVRIYTVALVIIVPSYLIIYFFFNLYKPKRMQTIRAEAMNIIKANTIGLMIFILMLYILHEDDFSREMMFVFYVVNNSFEIIFRNVLRRLLRKIRNKGFNQKHILLVGYSRAAEAYIDRIKNNPQWGYQIMGILDDNVEIGTKYRGHSVFGKVNSLSEILEKNSLDEIAITLSIGEYTKLESIVAECEKSGVHTKFIPDYNSFIPTKSHTEDLFGLPVINIRHVPLKLGFNKFLKRSCDILGSLILIVIFSPIMLGVAIAVRTTSKGPVIYKQERVGLHNRPFMMYKFRSMRTETSDEIRFTKANDDRTTPVGKIIRRISFDELPQFFNVLKGDMSLVGPRPERTCFVEQFKEEIPRYMIKHQVRPGMTGWAQVNGYRGDTSIEKRVEYDLYYIENWSLGLDFFIMFQTLYKGFINKNAY